MGGVPGTTALVEVTARQLCGARAGRYSALHAGWHYRATRETSSGVGCPAMGAKRLAAGRATGTIALVAEANPSRAPQGRRQVPAQQLIERMRSTVGPG
jgi:hypothetical protein